jgi:uncharacterized membrane protein
MRHQEASAVIGAPIGQLEDWLTDVENWPAFLVGVRSARRVGHERYRFHIVDGPEHRAVVVCVRHWPALHRFAWRALEGPGYSGTLDLRATDARHTDARIRLTAHPGTFVAGLAEMVLPRMGRAAHDLRNLESRAVGARS